MNLPFGWELRELKEYPGRVYYYNTVTHESTWIRPLPYPGLPKDDIYVAPLISVMAIFIQFSNNFDKHSKRKSKIPSKSEAKKQIEDIYSKILQGGNFKHFAEEKSDLIPNQNSWNIGWIAKNTMSQQFEEVAWSLGIGEMSQPIEIENGYLLILRNG